MKAIVNGNVLVDGALVSGQALLMDSRVLGLVDTPPENAEVIDAQGGYVSPGLIDVHCHGFGGREAGDIRKGKRPGGEDRPGRSAPSHSGPDWRSDRRTVQRTDGRTAPAGARDPAFFRTRGSARGRYPWS